MSIALFVQGFCSGITFGCLACMLVFLIVFNKGDK